MIRTEEIIRVIIEENKRAAARKRRQRAFRILILLLVCSIAVPALTDTGGAAALTVPKVKAHAGRLTTGGVTRVFITGSVSVSKGQDIVVYDTEETRELARQKVTASNGEGSFLVWIPQEAVNQNGPTGFRVCSMPAKGIAASKTIRLSIGESKRKKEQTIKCPARLTLTNLKTKASLKARTSSGLPLTYRSSNKKVAKVDAKGRVRRMGNGRATITIRQEGSDKYKPAETKIMVVSRKSNRREQIDAAVAWAVKIARDNSFSYGTGSGAHHFGCYFCGTNYGPRKYMKPSSRYKKTYCCNPFISAAYAHGAKHPRMLAACRHAYGIGMNKSDYYRFGCWKCVGKPAYGKLQKGDVLVKYNHVIMYIGRHRLVEATGGTWSAGSIAVRHLSKSRYRQFSFVMRYTGY